MTVCPQKRDRCRLCFTLLQRDRSLLSSSTSCQKSYHLFHHIQRKNLPEFFSNRHSNRTVCFHDLIRRYLRTDLHSTNHRSNFICSDCSRILVNIEQSSKYLRKTVQALKTKFNKSNQLFTSSLAVKFQKKEQLNDTSRISNESLPITNSDDESEFDDIDDEESDDDTQPSVSGQYNSVHRPPHLRNISPSSSCGDSISNIPSRNSIKTTKTISQCNEQSDDDDEEQDDDDEDNENRTNIKKSTNNRSGSQSSHHQRSSISKTQNFDSTVTPLDDTNSAMVQLQLFHMMANLAAARAASPSANGPNHNLTPESMMNTLANMQRNVWMKMFNDPHAAAAAAALTNSPLKSQNSSELSKNKLNTSGRKRKSTPEKRIITEQRPMNNNGHSSPNSETEPSKNSVEHFNHRDSSEHPLELTNKTSQRSNHHQASSDVHNLVNNVKTENGGPPTIGSFYHRGIGKDEDVKEGQTLNDSSASLSSSSTRRSTTTKRQRLSTGGQFDFPLMPNHVSMVSSNTAEILSPNQHGLSTSDDTNTGNIQRQQRKLDPLTCIECGKVLFSDKTHLLHRQTHAKSEKQCWICDATDDDMKKHILSEHANQKFINGSFKCQHCEKSFPLFSDLEIHTKEHSKKKPFECPICHKRFGQQGNLSCHLRIHSGVKPFTCGSCGKAFRHSNSLRRHARTVHSASRGLSTSSNSLLLSDTSLSLTNDYKHETYDDEPSSTMIASDDGSSSTGGAPSPSMSNVPIDSDSPEQLGTN